MNKSKKADPILFQLFEFTPRKGDLRRLEIIKAAIACVYEEGIENTSFDKIGTRLGIGRAHVSYYFKTIDEVLELAVKYIIATAQQITVVHVTKAKTPLERIEAM